MGPCKQKWTVYNELRETKQENKAVDNPDIVGGSRGTQCVKDRINGERHAVVDKSGERGKKREDRSDTCVTYVQWLAVQF